MVALLANFEKFMSNGSLEKDGNLQPATQNIRLNGSELSMKDAPTVLWYSVEH